MPELHTTHYRSDSVHMVFQSGWKCYEKGHFVEMTLLVGRPAHEHGHMHVQLYHVMPYIENYHNVNFQEFILSDN